MRRICVVLSILTFAVAMGSSAESKIVFEITTIAGNREARINTDEGKATEISLSHPTAVAVDSKGNVYIADHDNRLIRKVSPDGMMTNVMGTGKGARLKSKEGVAKEMPISFAYGVAVDHDDNLYVLSRGQHVIYQVTADGIARVIAGTGERGYSGDGGPATEAMVSWPNHLVADEVGNLYVADSGNARIRKIDTDGTITTVAGTGEAGFSGDGGPATEAQIGGGAVIAIDSDGNLYIADFENNRIRKVTTDGIITTIAGTGDPKYNGEGAPAIESNIGEPCGVAVDAEGYVYIGDQVNHRVRVVTPSGTMYTVAGTGRPSYSGDGVSALEADLRNPDIIAFGPDGALFFPDNQNSIVRKLTRVSTSGS